MFYIEGAIDGPDSGHVVFPRTSHVSPILQIPEEPIETHQNYSLVYLDGQLKEHKTEGGVKAAKSAMKKTVVKWKNEICSVKWCFFRSYDHLDK